MRITGSSVFQELNLQAKHFQDSFLQVLLSSCHRNMQGEGQATPHGRVFSIKVSWLKGRMVTVAATPVHAQWLGASYQGQGTDPLVQDGMVGQCKQTREALEILTLASDNGRLRNSQGCIRAGGQGSH